MLVSDLLKNAARKWPGKEAVYCRPSGTRLTYQQFNERVNRLCHMLLEMGLRKGDRVCAIHSNCHVHTEILMAAAKCGWVLAEVDHRLSGEEIRYLLADAEPAWVIAPSRLTSVMSTTKASFPHRIDMVYPEEYEKALVEYPSEEPKCEVSEEDLLTIMYTSGTTGEPKGVMYTHKNLMAALVNLVATIDFSHSDRGLHTSPFSHIAPIWPFLLNCHRGATNVIVDRFESRYLLATIEEESITTWNTVPVMLSRILQTPGKEAFDISSLKWICYGASPIPVPTLKEALKFFGPILNQVYGCTEVYILTFLEAVDHVAKVGTEKISRLESCGLPLINTETLVVGPDESKLGPGQMGEIVTRGVHVSPGYWNKPRETAKSMKGGWFFTGDLATVDEYGFVYIKGRRKEIIVTGGENVAPKEVENVLHGHAAIEEAAVVGIPDARWGEAVAAFVVKKENEDLTEDDIRVFCGERLAGYKRPKRVFFVKELPRTTSGKVLKRKLVEGAKEFVS